MDKVEIGSEDDHDRDANVEEFEGVNYQNQDVLLKYKPGDKPIQGRGSYQDTSDGGVRYVLEIKDPETNEWKLIFDHVDKGDQHHDIKNYRGASAFRSAIRTDGHVEPFDEEHADKLEDIEDEPITKEKTEEQKKILAMLGYGNITFKKINPVS
jgi:hypothetical protein